MGHWAVVQGYKLGYGPELVAGIAHPIGPSRALPQPGLHTAPGAPYASAR